MKKILMVSMLMISGNLLAQNLDKIEDRRDRKEDKRENPRERKRRN